jgi:hypothetical protein
MRRDVSIPFFSSTLTYDDQYAHLYLFPAGADATATAKYDDSFVGAAGIANAQELHCWQSL